MNAYIDIRLLPDDEMRVNVLLNKVFSKLHKALFDLKSNNIGISFPETKVLLGQVIRIHSKDIRIQELMDCNWLGGLKGYCSINNIAPVPSEVRYRKVSRWQHNMSESNLRRLIKRGTITKEEIKAYRAKMFSVQLTELPFLELESTSNGNHHRRYIKMSDLSEEPVIGEFDKFGLSKDATIPWF
jgi:CRISPR-associated endonuclease Csy4